MITLWWWGRAWSRCPVSCAGPFPWASGSCCRTGEDLEAAEATVASAHVVFLVWARNVWRVTQSSCNHWLSIFVLAEELGICYLIVASGLGLAPQVCSKMHVSKRQQVGFLGPSTSTWFLD